ncbi:MAG: 4-hydroxy-3-methylbut-2-enyl diphosphate reductase [Candidatus Korobacteraceae bacterium]
MTQTEAKTLLLLKPRGFCAGVVRAIDIVRIALETFGAPIYVRKEIVHNRYVVDELTSKGAIFVDSVDEVPAGERVIYSAHGVAPEVRQASKLRELRVIDATCPLVTKVHVEAVKFAREGYSLILIGHRDHDEVIGTLGEAPLVTQVVDAPEDVDGLHVPDPDRVAYLTQTTLSLDETRHVIEALRKRFPNIQGPHAQDICYATEKDVAAECDLLLVVGSDNSSNSNRLVEVARNLGTNSHLIENCSSIRPEWLQNVNTVGLTAGASAPEILVQEVVTFLEQQGFTDMREIEVMPENVRFGLPAEIVEAIGAAPAIS